MKPIIIIALLCTAFSGTHAQKNRQWADNLLQLKVNGWSFTLFKQIEEGKVKAYDLYPSATLLNPAQVKERITSENKVQGAGSEA